MPYVSSFEATCSRRGSHVKHISMPERCLAYARNQFLPFQGMVLKARVLKDMSSGELSKLIDLGLKTYDLLVEVLHYREDAMMLRISAELAVSCLSPRLRVQPSNPAERLGARLDFPHSPSSMIEIVNPKP